MLGDTSSDGSWQSRASGSGAFAIGTAGSNIDLTVNIALGADIDSQARNAIQASRNLAVVNNGTIVTTSAAGAVCEGRASVQVKIGF